MPTVRAMSAHHMVCRCPSHGLSMPITWSVDAHVTGTQGPANVLTFPV